MIRQCSLCLIVLLFCSICGLAQSNRRKSATVIYISSINGSSGGEIQVKMKGKIVTFYWDRSVTRSAPIFEADPRGYQQGAEWRIVYESSSNNIISATFTGRVEPITPRGTSGAQTTANSNDWNRFWYAFRAAVRKHNRSALKQLMSPNFEWAMDGSVSADEAIRNIDQRLVSWQNIIKSVNGRAVNCKFKDSSCWNFSGRQAKKTIGPETLVFELGVDGRWRWARLLGH